MNINRNKYFLIGVLLILIGVQFRLVDSFVLNEPCTKALNKVIRKSAVASNDPLSTFRMNFYETTVSNHRVKPPRWIGAALVVGGIVISLHSFALPRS